MNFVVFQSTAKTFKVSVEKSALEVVYSNDSKQEEEK
jgi:hypothetical protein